jgi:hypothetical protein
MCVRLLSAPGTRSAEAVINGCRERNSINEPRRVANSDANVIVVIRLNLDRQLGHVGAGSVLKRDANWLKAWDVDFLHLRSLAIVKPVDFVVLYRHASRSAVSAFPIEAPQGDAAARRSASQSLRPKERLRV